MRGCEKEGTGWCAPGWTAQRRTGETLEEGAGLKMRGLGDGVRDSKGLGRTLSGGDGGGGMDHTFGGGMGR